MSYTGPGDLKTFAGWWGLRAYSAATAGNNCADICTTAGGSTTTIKTLANGNFDVASASAALGGNSGFIAKLYDQTGGGNDLVQATGTNQPAIQLNVLQGSTLPEMRLIGAVAFANGFFMKDTGAFTVTNPWSQIAVVKPAGNFSGPRSILGDGITAGSGDQGLHYQSATQGQFDSFAFGGPAFTWSINNYHRFIGVNNGAASSLYSLDGSVTTFTGDTNAWTTAGVTLGDAFGEYDISGVEYGVAASGFSSSDATTMDSNINNYWFVSSGGDVLQSQIWM